MKVEAKLIHDDQGMWLAGLYPDGSTLVNVRSQTELRAILPYLQHAANCPPDRVRFTPEPMVWEHPTPWVWYSGDYTIVASPDGRCAMRYRDDVGALCSSLDNAQQAAARHRESH